MSRRVVDHLPDHMKFGYERVLEERAIRARLIAEGHDDNAWLIMTIAREVEKAHANDIPWRDKQRIWAADQAVRSAREAAMKPQPTLFTVEEMLNILARFDGANDLIGQSILTKVTAALPKDETDVPVPASS